MDEKRGVGRRHEDIVAARRKRWKRIGWFALGGIVLMFLIMGAGLEITNSPNFCASCHNMRPYVDSWRASSHAKVNCTVCHYEPGFKNYLMGKIKDGQAHLVIFITGKARGKYHAEISDSSCQQCHTMESLKAPREFKGVLFSHQNHLGELRRNRKLRCVTCHGQLVQGEHIVVDERDCFICHFKTKEDGTRDEKTAKCTTCHKEIPEQIPVDGHIFEHGRYIQSAVDCTTCHVGIIRGEGKVDYTACMECHSEKEKTLKELKKAKFTTESYHINHVTNHKVECWRCHEMIEHEVVRNPTCVNFEKNCTTCHASTQHAGPREMYRGTGGVGVPETPSKMFLANVDCASCHVKGTESGGNQATNVAYLALGDSCVRCHGAGYDAMLQNWKKLLLEAEQESTKILVAAEEKAVEAKNKGGSTAALAPAYLKLADARHNVEFVRNARGHHNVEYALDLLAKARSLSEEARKDVDPSYAPKPIPSLDLSCTTLCHSEVRERRVKFGAIGYPHKPHLDQGFKCTDCHGDMKQHGVTNMVGCNDCHHGTGKGKVTCADCHQDVKKLADGKGAKATDSVPDKMNTQIDCVSCHTQVAAGLTTTRAEVLKNCSTCHEAGYEKKADEWAAALKMESDAQAPRILALRKVIDARRTRGENVTKLANILLTIDENQKLIGGKRGLHNIAYAKKVQETDKGLLQKADAILLEHHLRIDQKSGEACAVSPAPVTPAPPPAK